jgi:sodium transport system ATP-binding protein
MIEILDVKKRFGKVAAVDGVSFSAADGSITAILGENGAGKTTTLSMICGLLAPDSGTIRIDGMAGGSSDVRRRVGALLDHQGLYPRLTARENVAYFGELQGLSGTVLDRHVEDMMQVLGLDRIADRRSDGFSQGERLKVALGRAIVHRPQNLLLDEVTNGLDITTVRSLRALLRRVRDEGRCVVFSSHVLEEVRSLCDHIVVISTGRLAAQGSADAICGQTGSATLEDAFVKLTGRQEMPSCLPV